MPEVAAGRQVQMKHRYVSPRVLAVPIVISIALHVIIALALPINAAVNVSVFRKEVVRRFNIIDMQKVKETELTEQRTYRVVETDPQKLVKLFGDVLYRPDLSGRPPEVIAVKNAPALGVAERAHTVPDLNVAARGLSAGVLASAAELADAVGEFPIPPEQPKPLAPTGPAMQFDTTFAASIGISPAAPAKLDAPPAAISTQPLAPSLAQPLTSMLNAPTVARPVFDLEKQPLAPQDIQPIDPLQGKAADLGAAVASAGPPGGDCIFRLMITGHESRNLKPLAKDVVFAIDISRTMPDDKITEARTAVQTYLPTIAGADRFNVVLLGEQLYPVFDDFVPATPENIDKALKLIDQRPSESGTDICRALATFCASLAPAGASPRPCNLFLVSNAAGNSGAAHDKCVATDLAAALRPNVSVFAFDSGAGSNRHLLDLIAQAGQGQSAYAPNTPGSAAVLVKLAAQHDKPLLASLTASYASLDANEIFPRNLPCLYVEQPLVIYGRAKPGEAFAVQVTGIGDGGMYSWFKHVTIPQPDPRNKHIEQGWARGKIDFLAMQFARDRDKKIAEQIRQLAARYAVPVPPGLAGGAVE